MMRDSVQKKCVKKDRRSARVNAALAAVLAGLLVLMFNYLSSRYFARFDISSTQFFTLSEKTEALLEGLDEPIKITAFVQSGHLLYPALEQLLSVYDYASDKVSVQWIDPDRDLARAEELCALFDVKESNVVLVHCGDHTKQVSVEKMADIDRKPITKGLRPVIKTFSGEAVLSSAIMGLSLHEKPVVYFMDGHGEKDIDSFDPESGYSQISRMMEHDFVEIKKWKPGEESVLPKDCDLLIIAGPQAALSAPEINLLRQYLDAGGNMFILLDAWQETGLAPLLLEWGVEVDRNAVVDPARTLTGRELFITAYEEHPVTAAVDPLSMILYWPCAVWPYAQSVDSKAVSDRPRVRALMSCSDKGWIELAWDREPLQFDPGEETPGPVTLAVAVEKGVSSDLDAGVVPTRMIVIADSDFAANQHLKGGNGAFFMSAVNWLLDRHDLLVIPPRPVGEYELVLSRRQLNTVGLIVVLGMPAAAALAGLLMGIRRKS